MCRCAFCGAKKRETLKERKKKSLPPSAAKPETWVGAARLPADRGRRSERGGARRHAPPPRPSVREANAASSGSPALANAKVTRITRSAMPRRGGGVAPEAPGFFGPNKSLLRLFSEENQPFSALPLWRSGDTPFDATFASLTVGQLSERGVK